MFSAPNGGWEYPAFLTVATVVQALLGEVVRLNEYEVVVQVYEDTTGLKPGDQVHGTGSPLSVPLGPGLLGHIYDGLLRRLDAALLGGAAALAVKIFGHKVEHAIVGGEPMAHRPVAAVDQPVSAE